MKKVEMLKSLADYLIEIPSIENEIGMDFYDNGMWWLKFRIDIENTLAWNVVQELGHVLNYISLNEKLPTVFMPVSPPPYLNGSPKNYLSWIIESKDENFTPEMCKEWLEGRLPRPVGDLISWENEE